MAVPNSRFAAAFQTYQAEIPNGDKVMVNGVPWPGVGHTVRSGGVGGNGGNGGANLNGFGQAFIAANRVWTTALCEADSDDDGQSNGFELGDPDCTWTKDGGDSSLNRTSDISHPGLASSMTNHASPAALGTANEGGGSSQGFLPAGYATAPPAPPVDGGSGFGTGAATGGGGGGIPALPSAKHLSRVDIGASSQHIGGASPQGHEEMQSIGVTSGSGHEPWHVNPQAPSPQELYPQAPEGSGISRDTAPPVPPKLESGSGGAWTWPPADPTNPKTFPPAPAQQPSESPSTTITPRTKPATYSPIPSLPPTTAPVSRRPESAGPTISTTPPHPRGRFLYFLLTMTFDRDIDTVNRLQNSLINLVASALKIANTSQVAIDSIRTGSTIVQFRIEVEQGYSNFTSVSEIQATIQLALQNGHFASFAASSTAVTVTVAETTNVPSTNSSAPLNDSTPSSNQTEAVFVMVIIVLAAVLVLGLSGCFVVYCFMHRKKDTARWLDANNVCQDAEDTTTTPREADSSMDTLKHRYGVGEGDFQGMSDDLGAGFRDAKLAGVVMVEPLTSKVDELSSSCGVDVKAPDSPPLTLLFSEDVVILESV